MISPKRQEIPSYSHLIISYIHTLTKAAQPEHLKPGSLKVLDNQLEYPGASNTHRDAWTLLNSQFWHVDTSNAIDIIRPQRRRDNGLCVCWGKGKCGEWWSLGFGSCFQEPVTIYITVHLLFIAYCQCPAIETRLDSRADENDLLLPPVTLENLCDSAVLCIWGIVAENPIQGTLLDSKSFKILNFELPPGPRQVEMEVSHIEEIQQCVCNHCNEPHRHWFERSAC